MSRGLSYKTPVLYHCLNSRMDPIVNPHCVFQRTLGSHTDLVSRVPCWLKCLLSRTNADSLLTHSLACGYVPFTYHLVIWVAAYPRYDIFFMFIVYWPIGLEIWSRYQTSPPVLCMHSPLLRCFSVLKTPWVWVPADRHAKVRHTSESARRWSSMGFPWVLTSAWIVTKKHSFIKTFRMALYSRSICLETR